MKNFTRFFTLLLLICSTVFAQDTIYKKDGSELSVKITDISDSELKYQKSNLSVSFSLKKDEVALVVFENGEKITFENTKNNVSEKVKVITDGTIIPLKMNETISSDKKFGRRVNAGEIITLTVQADVTDSDGYILVKQGTKVGATITKSIRRKAAGTKGKLAFDTDIVKATDGQSIPIRLNYDSEGKSRTGAALAAGAIVALPLVLIKGKAAVIEAGTVFNALVVGDKKIVVK